MLGRLFIGVIAFAARDWVIIVFSAVSPSVWQRDNSSDHGRIIAKFQEQNGYRFKTREELIKL